MPQPTSTSVGDETRAPRAGLLARNGEVSHMQRFDAPLCFADHLMNVYDVPAAW